MIIAIAVGAALLGGGGYVGYKKYKKSQAAKAAPAVAPVAAPPVKQPPAPTPAPGVQPVFPPQEPLPKGTEYADILNGLFSADPDFFGNPDLAGAKLCAMQTVNAFPNTGQGAATIRMNAGDEYIPGVHVKVWPMVANVDGTFTRAPEVGEGTHAGPPYLDAYIIDPRGNLTAELHAFRLSTNNPPQPGGPMV